MYKPYEKKFGRRGPVLKLRYRLRPSHLKFLLRKLRYRIKYHTNYEATWSLDVYSLEWLYYHLWRYLEDAGKIIDLDQEIVICDFTWSLREACQNLMRDIERILFEDYGLTCSEEYADQVVVIFNFYGHLAPYLWY